MCYRVNDLSKLKDYGFVNTYKDIYSLNLNSVDDTDLHNDYSLSILVNANFDDNGPNAITINHYANVQNMEYDEPAGCDELVDISKVIDVINKMIADGVAYKVSEEAAEEVDNESYEEICKEDYEPDDYDRPDDNGDYYYDMMKDDGYHLDGGYWTF